MTSSLADYSLTLQSPDGKRLIGTLEILLQMKTNVPQEPSRVIDSRQMVDNTRSRLVQSLIAEYSRRADGSFSSQCNLVVTETPESDGPQALSRIQMRLESMRPGKLKMSLDLVDQVAKVSSY